MQMDVQYIVARCQVRDKVCTSFNSPKPILQPLSIIGLSYSLSLNFARPLPTTKRHNKYVLVMIKHFSKWIELMALPNMFSEGATYAFL